MQCYNCINPAICSIDDFDEMYNVQYAWCEKCCKCSEKECDNNITTRVYWSINREEEPTMYRDVCNDHISTNMCHCSQNSKNTKLIKYSYN